jgi:hypothetical protein
VIASQYWRRNSGSSSTTKTLVVFDRHARCPFRDGYYGRKPGRPGPANAGCERTDDESGRYRMAVCSSRRRAM